MEFDYLKISTFPLLVFSDSRDFVFTLPLVKRGGVVHKIACCSTFAEMKETNLDFDL